MYSIEKLCGIRYHSIRTAPVIKHAFLVLISVNAQQDITLFPKDLSVNLLENTDLESIEETELMTIGKVIRKYRKELGFTQEEMAKSLGVTAPAVNKWENENTLPDISLLAPIARLLGISMDELLSFKENLTDEEVDVYIKSLCQKLEKGLYEEVFESARKKIEEYPNCEKLKLNSALIFEGARYAALHKKECKILKKYDEHIAAWLQDLMESGDSRIRTSAAKMLFFMHYRKEDYIKAEELLSYFDERGYERRFFQAEIHEKNGKTEEAFKELEDLMLEEVNQIKCVLNLLQRLYKDAGNLRMAYKMADVSGEVSRCFELGIYQEVMQKLELAEYEKDVEKTASIMKQLVDNVDTMLDINNSELYAHLRVEKKERSDKSEFIKKFQSQLIGEFCNEEMFAYMRGNEYWESLRNIPDVK